MSAHPPQASRSLPERPDLRHLKNQAKDILKAGNAASLTDAQRKLAREIDKKTSALNHDADDIQSEYRDEQEDLMQTFDRKFRLVLDRWAKDAGLSVVLDIGNPQTPAYWWANAVDITAEVVRAYDSLYHAAPASQDQR
jgi:Skp family chaperone for outer membrane proteins